MHLSANDITDEGIISIIEGLKTNNTLNYLHIDNNKLSSNMKLQLRDIQQYKRNGSNGYQQVENMTVDR